MSNFEKPLNKLTEEEIQRGVNQWPPQYGALALYELQRRLQEKGTKQINSLMKEIKELKDVTKINAETSKQDFQSANRLATRAVWIAIATLIAQVVFSTHQEIQCLMRNYSADNKTVTYQDCHRDLDFGLLGTYSIKMSDYTAPVE